MTTTARSEAPFTSTLPGRYYYDPAIYALEQERIFSRMWVCVGRAEALPVAGAYQTVSLGQENIIIGKAVGLFFTPFLLSQVLLPQLAQTVRIGL
jgi:hypothetical protein